MRRFFQNMFLFSLVFVVGVNAVEIDYIGKHKYRLPFHPRLLMMQDEEKVLLSSIETDECWSVIHKFIIKEADTILELPLPEYRVEGRRLLDVSREELRRIFFLSYVYRMTNDKKYAQRAEFEMLKCADFFDWNPSHFLDVAEMTLAMAIGYDWLFDVLSFSSKEKINKAILNKALLPSLQSRYNEHWLDVGHNWSQVCHTGLFFGALAVFENCPDIASKIINRAIDKMKNPMLHYAPDGVYPEGVSYWTYGTSFNVLFLDALNKIFHTDFELLNSPGFINTGNYFVQMLSPQLLRFNYSDSSAGLEKLSVPLFWFYLQTQNSILMYIQKKLYVKDAGREYLKNRLLPAALIWGSRYSLSHVSTPESLFWIGQGNNPVCVMRSGWDEDAAYLAIKGGSPSINHGHMDIGSFVFDVNNTRWIEDLGPENYHFIESQGIDLWDMSQSSPRWNILRYNNKSHNTLTLNNHLQNVSGNCRFIKKDSVNLFTSIDLSDVYTPEINFLYRSFKLEKDKSLVIIDSVVTGNKKVDMVWNICTTAKVELLGNNIISLRKNGESLRIYIKSVNRIALYTQSAQSLEKFDSVNPNTYFIRFKSVLEPNKGYSFRIEVR